MRVMATTLGRQSHLEKSLKLKMITLQPLIERNRRDSAGVGSNCGRGVRLLWPHAVQDAVEKKYLEWYIKNKLALQLGSLAIAALVLPLILSLWRFALFGFGPSSCR